MLELLVKHIERHHISEHFLKLTVLRSDNCLAVNTVLPGVFAVACRQIWLQLNETSFTLHVSAPNAELGQLLAVKDAAEISIFSSNSWHKERIIFAYLSVKLCQRLFCRLVTCSPPLFCECQKQLVSDLVCAL